MPDLNIDHKATLLGAGVATSLEDARTSRVRDQQDIVKLFSAILDAHIPSDRPPPAVLLEERGAGASLSAEYELRISTHRYPIEGALQSGIVKMLLYTQILNEVLHARHNFTEAQANMSWLPYCYTVQIDRTLIQRQVDSGIGRGVVSSAYKVLDSFMEDRNSLPQESKRVSSPQDVVLAEVVWFDAVQGEFIDTLSARYPERRNGQNYMYARTGELRHMSIRLKQERLRAIELIRASTGVQVEQKIALSPEAKAKLAGMLSMPIFTDQEIGRVLNIPIRAVEKLRADHAAQPPPEALSPQQRGARTRARNRAAKAAAAKAVRATQEELEANGQQRLPLEDPDA
jgi:hypothetical protein